MDDLVAVLDHGVTESQQVQLFYCAMSEPLRGHFVDKSQQPTMTYDALSREVVLFEAKSMPVSTFWHKDLDKGKKWKGRTISGQVRAKDHMILTLEEGGTDEVPYSQIERGLEEEDSSVGQGRSYAAVAAGGRPHDRGGQGQRGKATGGRGSSAQGVGGPKSRQEGGRGQGPLPNRQGPSRSPQRRGGGSPQRRGGWHPGWPQGRPWEDFGLDQKVAQEEAIWQWDKDCTSALKKLKRALIEYPVLKVADLSLPFVVTTNASQYGIGAVLQQDDDNGYRPQEDIHSLDDALPQVYSRLRQLEQLPVAAPDASSSNTFDRLEALEMDVGSLKDGVQLQQTATQQLEQRICTAANHSSSEPRETAPKFDGQKIFCDSTKTNPISWFRKLELTLQLHYVKEHKHHGYLYSRSGGACQAWLDNLLSKYGVVAADLHTKTSWDDLKAAWHKRFQVEPPEIKAMDKLMVFEQGTLPSVDWIAEYQRLTSVPDIQMGFKAIKHYFIPRSYPTLGNALTHVEDTLTTPAELFDKVAQIIVTNKEAKNLQRSSAPNLSRDQHRPKVVVVAAATPNDQTIEAVSANEGDRLAAAREGGHSGKGRGRGKAKTNTTSSPGPGATAPASWSYYGLSESAQIGKLSTVGSDSTTLSTPLEPVASRVTALRSEAHAEVDSPPLLYSFEDYAAWLVPTLGTQAQGQDVCAASSPSGSGDLSSSSGSSWDSAREFNIEVLDPLTSGDFAWLPLPTTGRLPGPQCAALCAHLHTYLSFYAPPTSPTDDEVAVGDILAYVTKVAREFRNQRYDNNNAPLLYVRIQVGQASCSALLDSGASRNFMSQAFMHRVGLGAQVRRKANPTTIKLADGRTQQLIDRYIEAVPVYFAPHACEPVTFDILDTDFDRRTLTVHDTFWVEVPCTIPLPHPSIRCQVVTAKSFRATCAYEQPDEIDLCFLRVVAVADSSSTDLTSDPRVVRLLDKFADIFESPTDVVPDRPISHEIILEAGVVPPKGCIYHMSEEELTVLRAQLDDLLDKGWIRPSSSP
ncbi:hypothetical protein CBR_g54892 [Chara braunii]|uniref:Reverse transcriptase/retrotransposon-derived protein RNase H-like domain-containing protein n=1 Tax=Chara braunii TaxID=69332 RepID=A0A388JPU3_CHABU|nr:hypothetical protein CBR_g54892 [Chara braunii]|eukprot:GBG59788.1 hypothetical protein CBR_g54892 [Chara braunii]